MKGMIVHVLSYDCMIVHFDVFECNEIYLKSGSTCPLHGVH